MNNILELVRCCSVLSKSGVTDLYCEIVENPGQDVTTIMFNLRHYTQSLVSQRLAMLRKNGLVYSIRSGKRMFYYPTPRIMNALLEADKKMEYDNTDGGEGKGV